MRRDPETAQRFRSLVKRQMEAVPAGGPDWLMSRRDQAARRLETSEPPDAVQEAWRYTRLQPLLEADMAPGPAEPISDPRVGESLPPRSEGSLLVLVNGRFAPEFSRLRPESGVTLCGLGQALSARPDGPVRALGSLSEDAGQAFSLLSSALMQDGVMVHVAPGVAVRHPVEILHLAVAAEQPRVAQPRHLILLEPGASARVVERFQAIDQPLYFNNLVVEALVGEGAALEHERLQNESPNAFHITSLYLQLQASGRYRGLTAAIGAGWSRTDLRVTFGGPGGECDLSGLYLAGDRQLTDMHLDVDHAVPGCTSRETFRGILDGRGRAVFDGRVLVREQAQKSDAQMVNANLMLSRNAEIDTKPQLEILADDVQCSHGTTVGQLDEDGVFYLRTRGLSAVQARRMLCMGFAREIIEGVHTPTLREQMEALLEARLGAASEAGDQEG